MGAVAITFRRPRVDVGSAVAGISDEKLQELRDRVDLVAIVQRRVPLTKSGRDFKGLCPFHGEKTPSFYVVPDKRIFHCFGCGATGDAIKFVMQLDGKGFREAIETLAQEVGLELAPADPVEAQRAARRSALGEVNEKACRFYERILWEHPLGSVAREHLTKRGITDETSKTWRLGYAPNRWDALARSLQRDKVDPKLSEEAGLLIPRKKGEGSYDRFRGRLMIPIREGGRVVAFGGRLLEGDSEAKYMNSPESPLYTKGSVLFGLDKAREGIRREGAAAFVEGYFDAIGLHQAGIPIAVATCGTALTPAHLDLVQRAQAKEVIFVFDGDAAGRRAAQRSAELTAAAQISSRVLVPPNGEDPDETVARIGTEAFRGLIKGAQPAIEFLLDLALAEVGAGASIEERVRVVEHVRGIVKAAPSGLARELYVEKVAEKLKAPVAVVRLAFEAEPAPVRGQTAQTGQQRGGPAEQPGQQTRGQQGPGRSQSPRPDPSGGRQQPGALPDRARRDPGPSGAQQPPARPARPSDQPQRQQPQQQGPDRQARLEETERAIVVQMLLGPEMCRAVETSGELSRFLSMPLRDLAERAFDAARTGAIDTANLLATVEPEPLRLRLFREVEEAERGRSPSLEEQLKALQPRLQKHERQARQVDVLRKRAHDSKVPRGPG